MSFVVDSSTLISLAKVGRLSWLREFTPAPMAPEFVYKETVEEGKNRRITDALLIEKAFKDNLIRVCKVEDDAWLDVKELLGRELKEGDHSVIALAVQTRAEQVLTDDDNLARIAEAVGIKPVSSSVLALTRLKNKKIKLSEFRQIMLDFVLKNRISQAVSEEYLKRGEEIAKNAN